MAQHPIPFFSAFDDLGKCLAAASAVLLNTSNCIPFSEECREDIEHLEHLLDAVDCLLKQANSHMDTLNPLFDRSLPLHTPSPTHGG